MTRIWCCDYLFLLLIQIITIAGPSTASSWTYESQEHWSGECLTGQNQSPINLDYASSVPEQYVPFKLIDYNIPYNATITNNGHSVLMRFKEAGPIPKLIGGGLPDTYVLEQLHFHWESEHTINNERLPLEMHLVHYAEKYGNFDNAVLYPSGVAVLGVLFHISPDDDEYFQPFLELLPTIERNPSGQAVNVTEPLIASTFLPRDRAGFFRYDGSLTTPLCNEGIIWTIFTNTLPISPTQAAQFRRLWAKENTTLAHNYRNIQPLNGRTVYVRASPIKQQSAGAGANALHIPLIGCFILITLGVKYSA